MSDKYFSRVYRGWTLQQTDRGWIIVNAPNRDKSGPISPGPYSTFGIAENVVNRIMDNSYGPSDNPRNQNKSSSDNNESGSSYASADGLYVPSSWVLIAFLIWAMFNLDKVWQFIKVLLS